MAELTNLSDIYMFETEEKARMVLKEMLHIAHEYGVVLKSDFKDLIEHKAYSYEYKYGWLENAIKNARVVPTERGYFIEFPKSLPVR